MATVRRFGGPRRMMRGPGRMAGVVPLLYPVLVHAAVVTGAPVLRFFALVVLIVNVLGPWLFGPWLVRARAPASMLAWGAAAILIGVAAILVRTLGAPVFLYAAPVLICLALAWFFGRTLLAARTPLITTLASAIRGPLPPPVARYTRAVTAFWFVVMLVMAAVDIGLALFAPVELWSLCTNFVNYLVIALLLVGEWCVRQRVIGEYEDMSWREYIAALRRLDYRRLTHG
ncbi:hypothetical protein [Salinisphaera sp.]|uniref:COG4648 family protein n=1 Tax=Salinisphaera sp. TaxID=1914330 RepID=UPI002D776F40|nr:hypothetical protein [Salinisphaera sp.]